MHTQPSLSLSRIIMIKTHTYTNEHGELSTIAYADRQQVYRLAGDRERFAALMARGHHGLAAYYESHHIDPLSLSPIQQDEARECFARLLNDTAVVLRIQELQQPILRRLAQTIEYNLQTALKQCSIAWDLAFAKSDVKAMIKAIELQAKLSNLLTERIDVTHKNVELDEETTDMLIAMRDELRVRRASQKKMLESKVEHVQTIAPTP